MLSGVGNIKHDIRTDPPKMDIYLVNQNVYPNTQELVASDVDTSLGKYTIKAKDVGDVDTGYAWTGVYKC